MARGLIKVVLWIAAILLLAGTVLRALFVDIVVVGHNGMAPTLFAGDEVLAWRNPEAVIGAILLCESPAHEGEMVLGRVVGKPGQLVTTNRGQLVVAGSEADYDYQGTVRFDDRVAQRSQELLYGIEKLGEVEHTFFIRKDRSFDLRPTQVTDGLYLLGDHRAVLGYDSRTFGEVEAEGCRSRVFMRLRPSSETPETFAHGLFDLLI